MFYCVCEVCMTLSLGGFSNRMANGWTHYPKVISHNSWCREQTSNEQEWWWHIITTCNRNSKTCCPRDIFSTCVPFHHDTIIVPSSACLHDILICFKCSGQKYQVTTATALQNIRFLLIVAYMASKCKYQKVVLCFSSLKKQRENNIILQFTILGIYSRVTYNKQGNTTIHQHHYIIITWVDQAPSQ